MRYHSNCKNCSQLKLNIELELSEHTYYICNAGKDVPLVDDVTDRFQQQRFPIYKNYSISWFECCGGVSYLYLWRDSATIVTEAPIPRPIIPADSIDNMLYGTLVGFAGFIVIGYNLYYY